MSIQTLLAIVAVFSLICLWQLLAGLAKLRAARREADPQRAAFLAKFGKLQAWLGGGMLAVNVLLNLPTLLMALRPG